LLEALLPASEEAVAIVLAYRPEGGHPALDLADRARRRFRHRFHELELKPLSPKEARELAFASARAGLPTASRRGAQRALRRQPVLLGGGAPGPDRARRAAPPERAAGASGG